MPASGASLFLSRAGRPMKRLARRAPTSWACACPTRSPRRDRGRSGALRADHSVFPEIHRWPRLFAGAAAARAIRLQGRAARRGQVLRDQLMFMKRVRHQQLRRRRARDQRELGEGVQRIRRLLSTGAGRPALGHAAAAGPAQSIDRARPSLRFLGLRFSRSAAISKSSRPGRSPWSRRRRRHGTTTVSAACACGGGL